MPWHFVCEECARPAAQEISTDDMPGLAEQMAASASSDPGTGQRHGGEFFR